MALKLPTPPRSPVFASFRGRSWVTFTPRRLPDGSWAVLRTPGPAVETGVVPGVTEMVVAFPRRDQAHAWAARLADRGAPCEGGTRRPDMPLMTLPLAPPRFVGDTTGPAARLGPVIGPRR